MLPRSWLFVALFLLASCAPQPTRLALLLWSPNDWSETEVYEIVGQKIESGIRFFEIQASNGDRLWVEDWRIDPVASQEEAQKRLQAVDTRRYLTLSLGARLWQSPDPYSEIVAQLGKGQRVRIVAIPTAEPRSPATWLEVVTERGVRGFLPSYMIGSPENPAQVRTLAALIDQSPWRPRELLSMLDSGRIRLDLLRQESGFFLRPEEGLLRIVYLSGRRLISEDFVFSRISEIADDRGSFSVQGPIPLRIEWPTEQTLRVTIGRETRGEFEFVSTRDQEPDPVAARISEETAKRQDYLNRILELSHQWRSANYGLLQLSSDGSFVWTGMDRLIPYLSMSIQDEIERASQTEATTPEGSEPEGVEVPPLERYLPWFGAVTHGGYEQWDDPAFRWEGRAAFEIYAPLPPRTHPIVADSGYPMGLLLYLQTNIEVGGQLNPLPLPFAVGFETDSGEVKGLVLIPLPVRFLQGEGDWIETLPRGPVILYFTPAQF